VLEPLLGPATRAIVAMMAKGGATKGCTR
jgi:hypothetical protein